MASLEQLGAKVSIIIPVYNRVNLIRDTLGSVINQSYPYWECIVVDDGSTDGSQEVVKTYANRNDKIKFYQRDRLPKGAPTCRNIGVEKSKGDYIIFLDSDDLMVKNCLEQRVNTIKGYPNLDFAVFTMGFFNHYIGDREDVWLFNDASDYISGFLRRAQWAITNPIWKRKALKELGGFDETFLSWQDWDLHIRALAEGYCYKVFGRNPDSYCRRGNHAQMNQAHMSLGHTKNRILLFEKIYSLLKRKGLLSKANKKLIAGQYLIACTTLHRQKEQRQAVSIWKSVYQDNLLSLFDFYAGLILIKISLPRILFDSRISFHVWIRVVMLIRKRFFYPI